MKDEKRKIRDNLIFLSIGGASICAKKEVSDNTYNEWIHNVERIVHTCSYEYNPNIYLNFLKVCMNALPIKSNNDKMRYCLKYLLGVAKLLKEMV